MGFWEAVVGFVEEWNAAGDVVDAYMDLPPTYKTSNDDEYFIQVIPDPVTEEGCKRALDRVDEAERKFNEIRDARKNKDKN